MLKKGGRKCGGRDDVPFGFPTGEGLDAVCRTFPHKNHFSFKNNLTNPYGLVIIYSGSLLWLSR